MEEVFPSGLFEYVVLFLLFTVVYTLEYKPQ